MALLELREISKPFGVVKALDRVSLDIPEGKTLALVGQNGAGKSTLVKILTGVYQMDSGSITMSGKPVKISSPAVAKDLGIAQVYQRAELIREFSVAENIVLGNADFSSKGLVNDRAMIKNVQELLDRYGIPLRAQTKVKALSGAMRQLVAIAKVLYQKPKVIVWDEPTAVLSDKEVNILFSIIEELKRSGTTMIYISHRLEEIFKICENVAVMRDGILVATMPNVNLTKDMLIEKMLGRSLEAMYVAEKHRAEGEVVLKVCGLTTAKIKDVSFELHRSEILGVAGLVNSGRTETVQAIFGLDRMLAGEIYVNGQKATIRNSTDAVKLGLFLAPEDRKGQALVICRDIRENVSLSSLARISSCGVLRERQERSIVQKLCEDIHVKMSSIGDLASALSGGNQQKVVVAKAIMARPQILIFDEPTQGIDVGAKAEIYAILEKLRGEGMSIIVISSEIEEIQRICDRAIVMHEGHMTGEVSAQELDDTEKILQYMYRRV